jgi:acyl-CoA synthetase (NDP forming)
LGSTEGFELRDVPLDRLFRPRRVAVIGASGTSGSGPRLLWRTVKRRVEQDGGEVYPVNPGRAELDGVRCYHRVGDVPGDLDLVVIAGGDPLEGLKQTAEKRPRFVMMFAAGFAESGAEGARAQEEIKAIIEASGVHLLGPNTTLNSFLPLRDLPSPKVALVSHSGHQGRHVWEAEQAGMPLAYWAPTGNEVDLEVADFVKWFADQPDVGAISGYVEGFKDGATFRAAAAYARARRKPIVMVKVGRSPTGVANAQSHTAHVAGGDAVADGVFAQYSVVRVDTLDELTHTSHFLARSRPPVAPGVCVYSISGGTAAHLSDLMTAAGLSLPPLAEETQQRLRQWIPDRLRVSNPVDSGGAPTGDDRGRPILETLIADPGVGVVVCPFVANAYHLSEALVRDALAVAETTTKPICLIWGAPIDSAPLYQNVLTRSSLHVFRTFSQCLTALRAYFRYHADSHRRDDFDVETADGTQPAGEPLPGSDHSLLAGAVLNELDAKRILRSYGIPASRDVMARTPADAVAAAESLGYPVVVKGLSSGVIHKARHGMVHLGVATSAGVGAACRAIDAAVPAIGSVRLDGYLVSAMEFGGLELALGMVRDPVFGPAVMVGLGGSLLETVHDVAFRLPPFGGDEARRMLSDLRCWEGVRSAAGPSLGGVIDAVMAVQRMVTHLGDRLAEVDINPLLVRPSGVMALDGLVVAR